MFQIVACATDRFREEISVSVVNGMVRSGGFGYNMSALR